MSVLNKCFFGFSVLFLTGCAAVNSPEGGPKDETKPKLTEISPANGITNFKGQEVKLVFNEPIQLKEFNKQFLITPNTGNVITTKTNGAELILDFDKPLEPNTTYFLNLRDGVADLTEGNVAEKITLSFSTGAVIDSSEISGSVKDYLTNAPEENVKVALYPEADTGNIRNKKPWYYTITDNAGNFRLQNIKDGSYKIYALADKNANDIYDNDREKIGYLGKTIAVSGKLDSVDLKTVGLDTKKPFVLSVENNLDRNTIQFSEGIQAFQFKTLEKTPKILNLISQQDANGKQIYVYPENNALPKTAIVISTDSSGLIGTDTVKFTLSGKTAFAGKARLLSASPDNQITKQSKIQLLAPFPLKIVKNQPFTISEDSIKISKPEFQKGFSLNENKTIITFTQPISAAKKLVITVDTTAMEGINGKQLTAAEFQLDVIKKTADGSISGKIQTSNKNYEVELLDDKGKIVKTLKPATTFKFENLQPGNYSIRVKVDENNDGKWNAGNTDLTTLPEKIYHYPGQLTVRAKWEVADIVLKF